MGNYEIILPQATKNKVLNPSVETGLNGWTTYWGEVVTKSSEQQAFGKNSVKVVSDGGAGGVAYNTPASLRADLTYYISVWVYLHADRPPSSVYLSVWDGGTFDNAVTGTTVTSADAGKWVRLTASKTGVTSFRIGIWRPDTDAGKTFYADGLQVELNEVTTFCDGDQPGCSWLGLPHASESERSALSRAGGVVTNLEDDLGLYVQAMQGVGLPAVRNIARNRGHIPGQEFQRTVAATRVMRFAESHLLQSSLTGLHSARRSIIDAFKPDDLFGAEPFLLRYNGATEPKQTRLRYDTGLELQSKEGFSERIAMQFLGHDPYWESPLDTAVELNSGSTITMQSLVGRLNGKWSNMDVIKTAGGNRDVRALTVGLDGKVYVGGDFTAWNGVTGRNYLAAFDTNKQIYSDLVMATKRSKLLAYWPCWEVSGTNIENLEGDSNRDGTLSGATLDDGDFDNTENPSPSFDNTVASDYINVYSAALNNNIDKDVMSWSFWAKVSAAGDWTDSQIRFITRIRTDGNNEFRVFKTATTNQLTVELTMGGNDSTVNIDTGGPTGWFHVAATWDRATDEYKVFFNGIQSGSTQTGIGQWTGSLSSTDCAIGAASTVPNSGWNGNIAHVAAWNTVLTPEEILLLSVNENPWETVGSASAVNGKVTGLATGPDGTIYLSGHFTNVGDANGDYVTSWNGSSFSSLGSPASGITFTSMGNIDVGPDGKVWVCGNFLNLGGDSNADYHAWWDGTSWNGSSTNVLPSAATVVKSSPGNTIYFGGAFSTGNHDLVTSYDVDNNSWAALKDGIDTGSIITGITVDDNGDIYFMGNFTSIDGDTAIVGVTRWDGSSFNPLGSGTVGQIWATAFDSKGLLWVTGEHTSAGGNDLARKISSWDGGMWRHEDKLMATTSVVFRAIATGQKGQVFVGSDGFPSMQHGEITYVTTTGSAINYPRVKVKRTGGTSAKLLALFNETTGATLQFDMVINDGEEVTIDFAPGNRSITSSWLGIDRFNVLPSSQLGSWFLVPGENKIVLFMDKVGSPTVEAFVVFKEQYLSVD
jgi:hypothetical protein